MACDGDGNSQGCWSGADITECKITNLSNNELTTADAGDTIKLWAKVYSPHYPCDNFHIDYDFDGTIVGCYEDTLSYNTSWYVQWEYTIPPDTSAGWKNIYFRETIAGDTCFAPLYVNAAGCENYTTQTTCEDAGCYWYNDSCHQSYPPCSSLTTEVECERFGCWWYDGGCHSPGCSFIDNQTTCEGEGCYWWSDNTCHSIPENVLCTEITNEYSCWEADCYWWNGSCHDGPPETCEQIDNYGDCLSNECYWYDGSCHTDPAPPPCSSHINKYSCEAADCYWYDNSCHKDPYNPVCSDHTTQSTCEADDCYWWNGSCHSSDPSFCSDLDNSIDCSRYNCNWCNGACQSEPCNGNGKCETYATQTACENADCHWYPMPWPWSDPNDPNTVNCHSEPIYMGYLPLIVAGVGGSILLVALVSMLSKKSPQYSQPPPMYYPPPQYPHPPRYPQYRQYPQPPPQYPQYPPKGNGKPLKYPHNL